jgi:hypothetical protein
MLIALDDASVLAPRDAMTVGNDISLNRFRYAIRPQFLPRSESPTLLRL